MDLITALPMLLDAIERVSRIGAMFEKARSEGRGLSDAELDSLRAEDDAARARLDDALKRARAEGR